MWLSDQTDPPQQRHEQWGWRRRTVGPVHNGTAASPATEEQVCSCHHLAPVEWNENQWPILHSHDIHTGGGKPQLHVHLQTPLGETDGKVAAILGQTSPLTTNQSKPITFVGGNLGWVPCPKTHKKTEMVRDLASHPFCLWTTQSTSSATGPYFNLLNCSA